MYLQRVQIEDVPRSSGPSKPVETPTPDFHDTRVMHGQRSAERDHLQLLLDVTGPATGRGPGFRNFGISRSIVISVPAKPRLSPTLKAAPRLLLRSEAARPLRARELEMLKIQRSTNANNVQFALSGRIEREHLAELQRLIDEEAQRGAITLDLREVRLVDREAVEYLARCEASGVRLRNCPAYLRKWIASGKIPPPNPPRKTRG